MKVHPKSFMRILLVLVLLTPSAFITVGQAEKRGIQTWSGTYGSGTALSVVPAQHSHGFMVAGYKGDGWVMMVNGTGEVVWSNRYAPAGYYRSSLKLAPIETTDGGYVLGGVAVSSDPMRGTDAWLLKLDRQGNMEWSKTYGGPRDDWFETIGETKDGGYIAAGNTQWAGSHLMNGWVVRLDHDGNVIWQEAFAGEDVHFVSPTRDEGFLISGEVGTSFAPALWVLKLDSRGKVLWQNAYDVSEHRYSIFIADTWTQQTKDGGYILSAHVERPYLFDSPRPREALFLRLDSQGRILWQEMYGDGVGSNMPTSIEQTRDGGFIAAGRATQVLVGSYPSEPQGTSGPWLLKLDANGEIVWEKTYGGQNDFFFQAMETKDGGFVTVGNFANLDSGWVLKLNANGNVLGCPLLGMPTNMTLIKSSVVVSQPIIEPVATNASVTQNTITVLSMSDHQAFQCLVLSLKKDFHREVVVPRHSGRAVPD